MTLLGCADKIQRPAPDSIAENSITTFLNPWSYLQIRSQRELLERFEHVYLDGISIVLLARFFGMQARRVSFDMTSLAPIVFEECIHKKLKVALIGSTEEAINKATQNIRDRFPGLAITEKRNGYFDSQEALEGYCRTLVATGIDVVVVGMGAPKQEQFLVTLREQGWNGAGYTCGGFFHQSADAINYYPAWVDALQLRWLYRIYREPKLLMRYCVHYPRFLLVFAWDLVAR